MGTEAQINNLISDNLKVEPIEEAFNCVIVHTPDSESQQADKFYKDISNALNGLNPTQKENVFRSYLTRAATQTNLSQLNLLLDTLLKLVNGNVITAKMLSEQILSSDKLVYYNQNFWILCFQLLRKIISGVDYKGVREIMKSCREKLQSFPYSLSSSNFPQMKALHDVIEYIFDRKACLLPAYFIVNEIQKADGPETHWRTSELIANFVEGFRDTAQMLTIIGHSHMLPVVEHSGYADHQINPWCLDSDTLKFTLKGILPYDQELIQPQTNLLRFVLAQPYSRDMVCSMLNLQKQNKQRCAALEEQLVHLFITAMERSEQEANNLLDGSDDTQNPAHWFWLHLSSQLIYFVLFQFANFPNIILALHDKLVTRDLRKGRDHLMWVLLQFISGSIQRNPLSNFLPVLKLYDILYTEREPLPVPDYNKSSCTYQMSPTCIWIHLMKKAQSEHINIHRPIPPALKNHQEFLQHLAMPSSNSTLTMGSDFRITLLCNAYSTNQEFFSRPMQALIDTILPNPKNPNNSNSGGGGSGNQQIPTVPLSMSVLDSLTVHSKMSLIHSIVAHMMKQAPTKNAMSNMTNMAPALVETYSRLLVYTEIESLGIKGFLGQLLPTVFKSQAWGILYTLLEMFSYRMHHIQPHYRVQLLSHLHSLATVRSTNQMQLHLCVESTALRLINGLGSAEVQPQLSRYLSEPKTPGSVVSTECEELNRALILTLARSIHITGIGNDTQSSMWCKDLLNLIVQNTPHSWAQHTSQCFPPVLNEFFIQHNAPKENRQHLKKAVDEEYRKWSSMSNENDIITHFSVNGTPPLFLCLLFKMIFETDGINAVAYKILEGIGARALSAHLRKLCDYLVFEVANPGGPAHVNKCVDTINDMIWKYNVVTIDRLVLCLVLRPHEGSEAQICFFIIQLLLLKTPEFRNRLSEFVKENSPEHWKQNNWHEKHLSFHQKYPEKFATDESISHPPIPVFFSNVCLRFLPVLDIVIHRFIEIPILKVHSTLEVILEHLGCLYKFHDRPVTYLYNTLHYYEKKLRDNPPLKKKMVSAVIGSLKDVRPPNWALSESYILYIQKKDAETVEWIPELTYYIGLVRRLVETIEGKNIFPSTDWRFNEFPNPPVHALYITCVELLGLPVGPQVVANSILDVMIKGYTIIPTQQVHSWINAIGLIMAALPESYWSVIYDRLQEIMSLPQMVKWTYRYSPFEMFNFKLVKEAMLEKSYVMTLAMAHSILHHSGAGQLSTMPDYVKDKLKPIIHTEYQLIYLCHLVGPFLQRFENERSSMVMTITNMLYEIIEQVNKNLVSSQWLYLDQICDLLYHIKYMYVGDSMKSDLEGLIRRLRPALQRRLRFITHLNIDEIGEESNDVPIANVPTPKAHAQQIAAKPQVQQMTQQVIAPQQPPQQQPQPPQAGINFIP